MFMTDLKGFSFRNIFLKVTFQIGVYLVHPFKISKLPVHTHTHYSWQVYSDSDWATSNFYIFNICTNSVFSENMFFEWNSQWPSSSLMTPTMQYNHTARRLILKEKSDRRLQGCEQRAMVSVTLITADIRLCWTGSHGASCLFSWVDELNLTNKLWKHFRLSRSCWKTAELQMQRRSHTGITSSIQAKHLLRVQDKKALGRELKWTDGTQKLLSICPQSLGYLEPAAFPSIKEQLYPTFSIKWKTSSNICQIKKNTLSDAKSWARAAVLSRPNFWWNADIAEFLLTSDK